MLQPSFLIKFSPSSIKPPTHLLPSMSENSNSATVTHPVIPVVVREEVPICFCGIPAKLRESWKAENPGRRFYNCSRSLVAEHCCEFFRWVDPPINHHYKDLLRTLKQRADDMANNFEVSRLQKKLDKQKDLRMAEKEEAGIRIHELQVQVENLRNRLTNLMVFVVVSVGVLAVFVNMG